MAKNSVELKIVRVPLVGRPTLTFHRGVYRAERECQRMIDSGENVRVTMWIETEEEPYKRWPEEEETK